MKIAVVGAGIFGVTTALTLSENSYNVTLFEEESDILQKASKCNHNRLHFGFHYPRSLETALQSLDGFNLFRSKFGNSIVQDFPNYYLVHKNGKVEPKEYISFCNNANINYTIEEPSTFVNMDNISLSVKTDEPIFDYEQIKLKLQNMLNQSKVNLVLNTRVNKKEDLDEFEIIINTSYSNINLVNNFFDLPKVKLKLQDVIVPNFKVDIDRIGLTIVDGDFCSIMPKGFDQSSFLLYHVKYSVLSQIQGTDPDELMINNDEKFLSESIDKIYSNSLSYYPFLKDVSKKSYWRTIRALPINNNDERLSYLNFYHKENKKIINVLSGKITTCWLIAEKIKNFVDENSTHR